MAHEYVRNGASSDRNRGFRPVNSAFGWKRPVPVRLPIDQECVASL